MNGPIRTTTTDIAVSDEEQREAIRIMAVDNRVFGQRGNASDAVRLALANLGIYAGRPIRGTNLTYKPDEVKYSCIQCGCEIPPGKPKRKCRECRRNGAAVAVN